ncbi:MAG: hypothetical protein ACREM8_01925 [Vulcanimicrobiaceae bacterium]
MSEASARLIDGLLWYLECRNWAFEQISSGRSGSLPSDPKMHYSLYFANLFSAVDFIGDYLQPLGQNVDFEGRMRGDFPAPSDYDYARELRNAIVHRGLDPAAMGAQRGPLTLALCPPQLLGRGGGRHSCSFQFLVDLAACCSQASNGAILEVLERLQLLDVAAHVAEKTEILAAVAATPHMPDWAKAMAYKAFDDMDFESMARAIAKNRSARLQALLGSG